MGKIYKLRFDIWDSCINMREILKLVPSFSNNKKEVNQLFV